MNPGRASLRGIAGLVGLAMLGVAIQGAEPLRLASPDGRVTVQFAVQDFAGGQACAVYQVDFQGQPVIAWSRLGLELKGGPLAEGLAITQTARRSADQAWQPVCGERSTVRDHFNELRVELRETAAPNRVIYYTFRAYDAGAAFYFTLPAQAGLTNAVIDRERSEFRFPGDHPAWAVYTAQGNYSRVPLSQIKAGCERPLVVEMGPQRYAAVAEARLVDYARMKLDPLPGGSPSLVSSLGSKVELALPLRSPWRVVMVAESPGRLLENNDLLLNLNDPCALTDTSWIKPGKVIREVTLTTAGGRACVDFAVKRGLQYIEFDAGWYGDEYNDASDARGVNVDPKRSKGPLDLAEVIQYAKARDIGVILYVNRRALERQLDEILPLYKKWGVKGVKYGFVNVGSQKWTAWLHEAIRKAADHQLLVDVHDEYRGTGYVRTYPNLMTVEGIAGDETSPTNGLTLAIAFTRMLAGPADNTVCYYDGRVLRNASRAYQLAKPVCLFSPWQFLFWYDRPPASPQRAGGAGGAETSIGDDPELQFYNHLPTTWDDTRVLHGKIGEYAVITRRKGQDWFIGFMNSREPRSFDVPLDFLAPGRRYVAEVYSDDPSSPAKVRLETRDVNSRTVFQFSAGAQGGQAVRIVPRPVEF